MINQDTFSDYSIDLVDIIDLVQNEMIRKISRQLGKGRSLSDNDWKVLMLDNVSSIENSLTKTVKASVKPQAEEIAVIKQKSISAGLKDTDAQLTGSVQPSSKFITQNAKVLETVADKLTKDVSNANLTMLREASLDYVKNINEVLAVKEVGGITRTEATKQILSKWSKKGVPSLVDSLGRRWQPDAYVNMIVRTNSMQIAKKTQERRAVDYGQDLIITSQHGDQSPEHAPYSNMIYSLSGNSQKYPPFSEALNAGFMTRPNCRHTYSFYIQGVTKKDKSMSKKETDESYAMSQEQRKLERNIRTKKREIESLKSAGFNVSAESASLRDSQADMRNFINRSGRTRQRDREQI